MMKKEKATPIIHIKLEYPEAIQSKRDIIETQKDLIQTLKNVKRYHLIRSEELKLKLILLKKIKEFKKSIHNLNSTLPKIKIPDIIKHSLDKEDEKEIKKAKEIVGSELKQTDIEKELAELQKRLKELE